MVWVELHENEASRATEHNTPNGVLSRQLCVLSIVFDGGWQLTQRKRCESIDEFWVKVLKDCPQKRNFVNYAIINI